MFAMLDMFPGFAMFACIRDSLFSIFGLCKVKNKYINACQRGFKLSKIQQKVGAVTMCECLSGCWTLKEDLSIITTCPKRLENCSKRVCLLHTLQVCPEKVPAPALDCCLAAAWLLLTLHPPIIAISAPLQTPHHVSHALVPLPIPCPSAI